MPSPTAAAPRRKPLEPILAARRRCRCRRPSVEPIAAVVRDAIACFDAPAVDGPIYRAMNGPPIVFDRKLLARRRARAAEGRRRPISCSATSPTTCSTGSRRCSGTSTSPPTSARPQPFLADAVAGAAGSTASSGWRLRPNLAAAELSLVVGDEEVLPFASESLDLASRRCRCNSSTTFPASLPRSAAPSGPTACSSPPCSAARRCANSRESFAVAESELTGGASPRVAPFVEVRAAGALLQRAGFALPVVDQDRVTVRYADPLALMRDLRAMGATNVLAERSRRPLRRDVLVRAAAVYAERFADPDGRIRATFDVISLSGWAPHESQQQPLRPGSAKARLADVLGVENAPPARSRAANRDQRASRTGVELVFVVKRADSCIGQPGGHIHARGWPGRNPDGLAVRAAVRSRLCGPVHLPDLSAHRRELYRREPDAAWPVDRTRQLRPAARRQTLLHVRDQHGLLRPPDRAPQHAAWSCRSNDGEPVEGVPAGGGPGPVLPPLRPAGCRRRQHLVGPV